MFTYTVRAVVHTRTAWRTPSFLRGSSISGAHTQQLLYSTRQRGPVGPALTSYIAACSRQHANVVSTETDKRSDTFRQYIMR